MYLGSLCDGDLLNVNMLHGRHLRETFCERVLLNQQSSAYIFSTLIFRLEKTVSVSAHNENGFSEDRIQLYNQVPTIAEHFKTTLLLL